MPRPASPRAKASPQANADVAAAKAILDKGKITARPAALLSLSHRIRRVLRRQLQVRHRRFAEGRPERPVHSRAAGAGVREDRQPGRSHEVLYRQVLTINSHNPTNAFARPLAKKKLGMELATDNQTSRSSNALAASEFRQRTALTSADSCSTPLLYSLRARHCAVPATAAAMPRIVLARRPVV